MIDREKLEKFLTEMYTSAEKYQEPGEVSQYLRGVSDAYLMVRDCLRWGKFDA